MLSYIRVLLNSFMSRSHGYLNHIITVIGCELLQIQEVIDKTTVRSCVSKI